MFVLFDIPLVFYGENEAEYGNPAEDADSAHRDWSYFSREDESEIFLGGVSIEQLQKWLDEHGDAVLVNRKSTTWRGLDDQACQQPALALLGANPTLIKRPVIESGDNSFVGWTAEVQTALGLA